MYPYIPPGALNNFFVYGESLEDFGMCVRKAADGLGLVTRGFLWTGGNIWFNIDANSPITTTWTLSFSGASLTTTWTPSQYGLFGEYPP